jgi:hypothetical protein
MTHDASAFPAVPSTGWVTKASWLAGPAAIVNMPLVEGARPDASAISR